jgi:hypothetical protein
MLWWLTTNPIIHATRGANNTDCYAMPELGLAVARIQAAVRPGIATAFEERAALNPQTRRLYRRIVRR